MKKLPYVPFYTRVWRSYQAWPREERHTRARYNSFPRPIDHFSFKITYNFVPRLGVSRRVSGPARDALRPRGPIRHTLLRVLGCGILRQGGTSYSNKEKWWEKGSDVRKNSRICRLLTSQLNLLGIPRIVNPHIFFHRSTITHLLLLKLIFIFRPRMKSATFR